MKLKLLTAALAVSMLGHTALAQDLPTDPNYKGQGTWEQEHEDQWAIKRVGFTDDENSAWHKMNEDAEEVIVAVIDTGVDLNHELFINSDAIWTNSGEVAGNGIDDDGCGSCCRTRS